MSQQFYANAEVEFTALAHDQRAWNTVVIGMDVPNGELRRQIGNSYDLVKPKVGVRK
jgi:predicted DNA-binding protein (MmcQ/YjbR family)